MQFEEFSKSITATKPPNSLNQYALALWWDAKGNWETAHTIIQDIDDKKAARIHAYLHRKEGDAGNAAYWYNRAAEKMPTTSLETEWAALIKELM